MRRWRGALETLAAGLLAGVAVVLLRPLGLSEFALGATACAVITLVLLTCWRLWPL